MQQQRIINLQNERSKNVNKHAENLLEYLHSDMRQQHIPLHVPSVQFIKIFTSIVANMWLNIENARMRRQTQTQIRTQKTNSVRKHRSAETPHMFCASFTHIL